MGRSRRSLVRRQLEFAATHIDGIMGCLQQIDEIARGQSKKINETLPKLVELLSVVQKILLQFRHEL